MPDSSNHIPGELKNLLDEGRWPEAVSALDRALRAEPRQMSLWREKAKTLIALDDLEGALACYERMLEIDSSDLTIYAGKAEVLETLDRDDEALDCYDRALALAPSSVAFLHAKGRLLTRLKRIPEAIALYETSLKMRPQDAESLIGKGDALMTDGQFEHAAACFERAAAIGPSSFGAAEWTRRGEELSQSGQAGKALEFYDKAIQADARYSLAYQQKALLLSETPEKTGEALRCLDIAIGLEPKDAWFQVDKGNIYYRREEYQAAAECYSKAIELDPKSRTAWRNLGLAQESLERYDEAVVSAEKVIELDPASADGWLHKGLCLGSLERLEESIASYRRALELDPENLWANNNMGWDLQEMNKDEEALPYFEKAIEVDPTEYWAWVNKANSLRELGRHQDALDTLNMGLAVVSDKRVVLKSIGFLYTECFFEHDKGLGYYQQILELDPANTLVRLDIVDCLINMGQYAQGRSEAEKLVGQLANDELECCMSLLILASYAFEDDVAGRARQFEVVLKYFNICRPGGKRRKQEMGYSFSGLLNTIRSRNISGESKFLILTAIDVLQGNLARSELSFFNSARPQTVEAAADGCVTTDAGTTLRVPR